MNQYSVGNQIECLFYFANRQLTKLENDTFLAGGGLPAGVGIDQTTVQLDYVVDNGEIITITGSGIVRDNPGEYHAIIVANHPGDYKYRGYSLDIGGGAVASTFKGEFTVQPFP